MPNCSLLTALYVLVERSVTLPRYLFVLIEPICADRWVLFASVIQFLGQRLNSTVRFVHLTTGTNQLFAQAHIGNPEVNRPHRSYCLKLLLPDIFARRVVAHQTQRIQ